MIAKFTVNSVHADSYKSKSGETIPTLDLICFDKGEGSRVGHALIVAVDRSQKEKLSGVSLQDKNVLVDVTGIGLNFKGAVQIQGLITNIDELTGPLKVVKPEAKA